MKRKQGKQDMIDMNPESEINTSLSITPRTTPSTTPSTAPSTTPSPVPSHAPEGNHPATSLSHQEEPAVTQDFSPKEVKALRLYVILMRASRSLGEWAGENIRTSGWNPTEFAVLELLYHKGPQQVQQIGRKVLIASASITYVVDKLEGKGLVARCPHTTDRRVTTVSITPKGAEQMKAFFPHHVAALQQGMACLTHAETLTLTNLLKKLGHHAASLL